MSVISTPYTFVYSPAMLLEGTVVEILSVTFFCLLGAYGLSMALIGYGKANMSMVERLIAIAAAMCMVIPEVISSIVGFVIMAALYLLQHMRAKKAPKAAA